MKKDTHENPRKRKIIKWVIIIGLIIIAILFFMLSPMFNIKSIIVSGNKKTTVPQIQSLSELKVGKNIFQFSKLQVINSIEANPYISSVKVKRNLPSTVTITIEEKTPAFLLEIGNAYIYLDSQGYVLEISEEKDELPLLTSLIVDSGTLKPGDRLPKEDLIKIERALTIMSSARSNGLAERVISIDLKNTTTHTVTMTDSKTVHLGDLNNLNVKMLYLQEILEKEAGIEGEVFFSGENKEIFFRENIKGEEIIDYEQEGD